MTLPYWDRQRRQDVLEGFLPGCLVDQNDGARHQGSQPLELSQLAPADVSVIVHAVLSIDHAVPVSSRGRV
jgi:hypothetical protein